MSNYDCGVENHPLDNYEANNFHIISNDATQFTNDHLSLDFKIFSQHQPFSLNMRGSSNLRSNTHLTIKDENDNMLRMRLIGSSFVLTQQGESPTKYFNIQNETHDEECFVQKGIFDVEVKSPQPFVYNQNLKLVVSKIAKKTARHISKYITFLIEVEGVGCFILSFGHKKCMKTSVVFATCVYVSKFFIQEGSNQSDDNQSDTVVVSCQRRSIQYSSDQPSPVLSQSSGQYPQSSSSSPYSSSGSPSFQTASPLLINIPSHEKRRSTSFNQIDSPFFMKPLLYQSESNCFAKTSFHSSTYSTSPLTTTKQASREYVTQRYTSNSFDNSPSTPTPLSGLTQKSTLFKCDLSFCEFQTCPLATIFNHSSEGFDPQDRISVVFVACEPEHVVIHPGLIVSVASDRITFRLPAIPLDYCNLHHIKAKMYVRINDRVVFVNHFEFRNSEHDFAFEPLGYLFSATSNSQALSMIFESHNHHSPGKSSPPQPNLYQPYQSSTSSGPYIKHHFFY
ncbi:hypothetical protein C9374_003813 [Naegleria lovaniensis]|uniref:Uncharacterized protein n=1 Tax=Naegleria lovaniensis TaxID=51637 RepID=A0AA88H0M8_NAELO|nr:uncharacterized protein C9374_003813 [Naegleria lovaniensis]KAG2394049.1 hypothetical protein C9374_003813 [Naegleria lovaniensis]